jgi:hypothetical protein
VRCSDLHSDFKSSCDLGIDYIKLLSKDVYIIRNCSIIKTSFEMHFRTAIGNLRVDKLLLVNTERSHNRCFNLSVNLSIIINYIILLPHTRSHHLPVEDSKVLHIDHFFALYLFI